MAAPRSLLALSIALAVLLVAPAPSSAETKRVVLLQIEGTRSPALRRDIARLLRPNKVLSPKVYRRAAKRRKAVKLTPNNVAEVARYLEVHAVIDGVLVAEGDGYKLTVRVRAGNDGLVVKRIPMRLGKPRLSAKMKKGLAKRLRQTLADLPPPGGERGSQDAFEDEPVEEAFLDEPEEAEPDAAEAAAIDDADEVEEDERVAQVVDDEPDAPVSAEVDAAADTDDDDAERGPRDRAVALFAGLSVVQRQLVFSAAPDLVNAPLGYQGAPVPGIFVHGEAYPLALSSGEGGLGNLGLTFLYDKVVRINSQVENPDNGEVEVLPTTQQRWSVGAKYRINFGSKVTSPSLALSAGYNRQEFVIDKEAASPEVIVDIPNVTYTYVDPGLSFRMGATPKLFLFAEGRFLAVLETGEMQQPEQYGSAQVTGLDADVGFEYGIGEHYLVRAGARFTQFGYAFQGNGNMTDRNGDGELDVGGAADRYLGGYVTAGFGF